MARLKPLGLLALIIFGYACMEVPPPVDLRGGADMVLDTTYVDVNLTNTPQDRVVLIEDLTGVRCTNCPDAAKRAKDLKSANPTQVVIAGLYTSQPNNLTFPHSGSEDLRTENATNIYANLYGSPPLPGGGVNRKPFPGETTINQQFSFWGASVNADKVLSSVINLDLQTDSINDSTIQLVAKATFMEAMEETVFVSIMLLENDIEAAQTSDTGDIHDYVHEHVLRQMYTPYNGAPFYTNAEKGRHLQASWQIVLPNKVRKEHASLVLFVNLNEADNKEVLQCKEIKL
ncbi:MAG: Omp28-related outer membrane protein [Bacteroidia bacterium]